MKQRPFVDTLRDVEFGSLLEELAEIQHEVVTAVSSTDKAGKIVIEGLRMAKHRQRQGIDGIDA